MGILQQTSAYEGSCLVSGELQSKAMTAPEPPSSRPTPITEFQSAPMVWPVSLIAHYFIAVVGAMIIGFVPEALLSPLYYDTRLEPFAPAIAFTALLLGYFVSYRVFRAHAARWIWVLGLLWLTFGMFDETKFWSPSWSSEKSRAGYALAQFFGPSSKSGASEGLLEVFYTMPFVASVMYSVGSYVRKRKAHQIEILS
jgi:hypothetical protein